MECFDQPTWMLLILWTGQKSVCGLRWRDVCRLSRKLPIKTEKGTLNIDVKALGKVLWRSTILHIFR